MDPLLAAFAVTVLVLGMVSRLLKRHALSPVLLALAVGVLIGPAVLGWIDPAALVGRTRLLEELTRVGLALGVADIALQVTRGDLRRNARHRSEPPAAATRRPPVAGAALLATGTGPHSRLFLAWFGPLGVAGIYYLAYVERYGLAEYERLFAAGSLAICASVVVHTLTSTPAVRWYAHRSGTERAEGGSTEVEGALP